MTARAFVRFAWITLGLTLLVIVWGAVVRATGSGAGCGSHWPLCNGDVVPLAPATTTLIEYVHRLTSGVVMLLAVALVVGAYRAFPAGHRARTWAWASLVFMLIEAAVGAGLVLLGLVEGNTSMLRAAYIAVHLTNTMLLVAAMTGTVWWASQPAARSAAPILRSPGLAMTLLALLVVAATGAVVALGNTLFPSASLAEGLAADFDASSHILIRLRAFHPVLAVVVAAALLVQTRRDPTFRTPHGHALAPIVVTLVLAQAGLGVINLLMLAPITLQMTHLLGSNLLWMAVVWAWLSGTGVQGYRVQGPS
jgi:heme A synthase